MFKRFACLLIVLCAVCSVSGQKKKPKQEPSLITADEWHNVDVFEQHRLYSRANVIPYREVDDIERLAYRESPYYVSLNGTWRVNVQPDYESSPRDMELASFDPSQWPTAEVPSSSWMLGGKPLMAASVRNGAVPMRGNAVITFYREFNVPQEWAEYSVFLQLQARSAYYIWVNQAFVGYSEDSRSISEFDITKHLQSGKPNSIVVQVISTSDGSLLECSYSQGVNGITGDVALVLKSAVNVQDYTVRADYDGGTGLGELSIDVNIANVTRKGRYYVEAEIWTPEGKELEKIGRWVYFDKSQELKVNLEQAVGKVKPWSAETPNLYTAVIRLRNEKMVLQEATGTRFGFRTVEVRDGQLQLNGRVIKLRGVAYSGYDAVSGQLCDEEQMLRDIERMKRNNVNAVRTTVYSPLSPYFYELCDKYGLYVMCDANIQPYSTKDKVISVDKDYADLFVVRAQNMYESYKNHTSIILWSLGNGSDNGVCMESSYRVLKEKDPTRPVVYSGAQYNDNTDAVFLSECSLSDLKQFISRSQSRPLIINKPNTAVGNGFGGMESYWKTIRTQNTLAGGFFTNWRSCRSHDVNMDVEKEIPGLVSGDDGGHDHPSLAELQYIYRGFDVRLLRTSPDEAEFVVTNYMDFSSMSDYVLDYVLYTNYKDNIISGEVPQTIGPGQSSTFRIRVPRMTLYSDEELRVRFLVHPRMDSKVLPKSTTLSVFEFQLDMAQVKRQPLFEYDKEPLSVEERDGRLHMSNRDFSISFDLSSGTLVDYKKGGAALLARAPMPNFWRAATDNDCLDANGLQLWQQCSPSSMIRSVEAVSYRQRDKGAVVIDVMSRYSDKDSALLFEVKQVYEILYTGDVLIDNEIVATPAVRGVPKVGMQLRVPKRSSTVTWYGAASDSYPDRKGNISVGVMRSDANALFYRYDRPQDAGNRTDVRWLTIGDTASALYCDMPDSLFNFSVYPYTDDKMLTATSYAMLDEENFWTVNLDYKVSGLGSASAGTGIAPEYLLNSGRYHFLFHLMAFDPRSNQPGDFRKVRYPEVVSGVMPTPVVRADRERFDGPMTITLTDTVSSAEIHYTLDGKEPVKTSPLYKKPFVIDRTTVVKARAYGVDATPSFVVSKRYDYDYVVATSFTNAPNTPYNRNASTALFDGVTGSPDDLSRGWLGFSGNDVEVVVRLGKTISVQDVSLRFAHSPEAWAFAPKAVTVQVSADGTQWSAPRAATIDYDPSSAYMTTPQVKTVRVELGEADVRYIKITAKAIEKIPDWHKAKGLRPWMLIDELYVTERYTVQ